MAKAKKLPSGNWRVNLYDYTDPAFPTLHGLAPEAKGKDHHPHRGASKGIAGSGRGH